MESNPVNPSVARLDDQESDAYMLADWLHATYFEGTGPLSQDELDATGVERRIGSSSSKTSERIEATDEIERHWQVLAKSRNGIYYLSTTGMDYGGRHTSIRIAPGETDPEKVDAIESSVFMQRLMERLLDRAGVSYEP